MSERKVARFSVVSEVIVPRVPNFIRVADSDMKLPVSAITEDGLREIGRLWTDALIERAKEQRTEAGAAPPKRREN